MNSAHPSIGPWEPPEIFGDFHHLIVILSSSPQKIIAVLMMIMIEEGGNAFGQGQLKITLYMYCVFVRDPIHIK